jgi:hypothetical protein
VVTQITGRLQRACRYTTASSLADFSIRIKFGLRI